MQGDKNSPVAEALRKAGFVPLPRLWVKPTDMPKIHEIAEKHRMAVNNIRGAINSGEPPAEPDPVFDKDAAWEAYEKMRSQG